MRRYWPLLLVFLGLFLPAALYAGCAPMESRGSINSPKVDQRIALTFAAARTALALADAAEATWLDSLPHPTDDQLANSSARVAKLQAVRDVLERVRQHLDGAVSADLNQAVADLKLLVASAQQFGVKVPPEAISVLNALPTVSP